MERIATHGPKAARADPMIDTMTATKVVGALCGALLIFLLGNWAGELVYHVGSHEGEQAYTIEVADAEEPAEGDVEQVSFEDAYAGADPAAGEAIFRQCSSCHKLEEGANATGPHLYGVVGRPQDAISEYPYSSAFAELGGTWTPEELDHFLANPSEYVPGTKMTYRGLADVQDRADIIAYLATVGS